MGNEMKLHNQSHDTFLMHRASLADEPHPKDVVPFGKYGGGRWTCHPIGFVVAGGIVLIALIGMPESRYFLAGALPLGALFGLILWKAHQWKPGALKH
jgi:hypothetical protein